MSDDTRVFFVLSPVMVTLGFALLSLFLEMHYYKRIHRRKFGEIDRELACDAWALHNALNLKSQEGKSVLPGKCPPQDLEKIVDNFVDAAAIRIRREETNMDDIDLKRDIRIKASYDWESEKETLSQFMEIIKKFSLAPKCLRPHFDRANRHLGVKS